MHTNHGPIELELFDGDAPKTVENFHKLSRDGYYDGLDLPPRDPGLHDPGRLPRGHRHRRPRLRVRGRVQRPQDRARRARDGERRPEHERQPVLHRHDRGGAVARRQAHRVRQGHARAWRPSTRSRASRPAPATARSRTRRSSAWRSMTVELLWWEGCPSHPDALDDLQPASCARRASRPTWRASRSTDDEQARRERFPGSPTIRIDGEDIVPPGDGEPVLPDLPRLPARATGGVSPTAGSGGRAGAVRRAA